MEHLLEYIEPSLFILIIFLWALGLFLKKAPWFTQEWSIPYILLGVSTFFTIAYMSVIEGYGFSGKTVLIGIIQAVLIAAVAVFGNELVKQLISKRFDDQ